MNYAGYSAAYVLSACYAQGSSEVLYEWTNGTLEYDVQAIEALEPYM